MNDILNYFEAYASLKPKQKNILQKRSYSEVGTNMLACMFDYSNMYEGFFENIFEFFLIKHGCIMTTLVDGELVSCPATPVGLPNDNGEYTEFIGWTLSGKTFNRTNHEDCVICYNTKLGTPDRFIDFFADILACVDRSLELAVLNSRNIPIPVGKDSKSIESIKEALKAIKEGRDAYILDKNILDELEEGIKSLEVLNISDVSTADKIQYLSKTHDDLIRRISTLYGHDFNGSPKSAQQSIKEITGSESFSWIIPIEKRKQRLLWLEELKELFPDLVPEDASLEFSPTWLIQYAAFVNEPASEQSEEHMEEDLEESKEESLEESKEESLEESKEESKEESNEESLEEKLEEVLEELLDE